MAYREEICRLAEGVGFLGLRLKDIKFIQLALKAGSIIKT
jgi:hypothetical protein